MTCVFAGTGAAARSEVLGLFGGARLMFDRCRRYRLTKCQRCRGPGCDSPGLVLVQVSTWDHLWPLVSARYSCAPLILRRISFVLFLVVAQGAEIAVISNLCCPGGCPHACGAQVLDPGLGWVAGADLGPVVQV